MTLENYRTNLASEKPARQAEFIRIAASVGDLSAISFIVPFARHSEAEVREAAVKAIGEMGDRAQEGALDDRLYDGSRKVQIAAINALAALAGPEAEPALLEKLPHSVLMYTRTSDELPVLKTLITALGKTGSAESIPALSSLAYQPEFGESLHPELSRSLAKLYLKGPSFEAVAAMFELLSQANGCLPRIEVRGSLAHMALNAKSEQTLSAYEKHISEIEGALKHSRLPGAVMKLRIIAELHHLIALHGLMMERKAFHAPAEQAKSPKPLFLKA